MALASKLVINRWIKPNHLDLGAACCGSGLSPFLSGARLSQLGGLQSGLSQATDGKLGRLRVGKRGFLDVGPDGFGIQGDDGQQFSRAVPGIASSRTNCR